MQGTAPILLLFQALLSQPRVKIQFQLKLHWGFSRFFFTLPSGEKLAKGRGYYNPIIPPLQAIFHQIIRRI